MAGERSNRNLISAQYKFTGKRIDEKSPVRREVIKLLPSVHQTETLQKFFGSSVDHLFEPGSSTPVNGYIGHRTSYSDPTEDFYIRESTPERQFYQLEPTMVSRDSANNIESVLFYDDLLNQLRFQGGLVNNHNRLFTQNYYSWCPSIDLDKFMNFREYYWIPEGPEPIAIYGHSSPLYVGDGYTRDFALNPNFPYPNTKDHVSVTVDGVEVFFLYDQDTGEVRLDPPPSVGAEVRVYTAINLLTTVTGLKKFELENSLKFSSNTRIVIKNDIDSSIVGKIFIIEGVGDSITLVADDDPNVTLRPDYITIGRGSYDNNPWSRTNRWFHRSVVDITDKNVLKDIQAKRPIIEFNRNIQLYNYGSVRREAVHLVAHNVDDLAQAINGLTVSKSRIDGTVLTPEWIQEHGENGVVRILTVSDRDYNARNKVFEVRVIQTGTMLATLVADGSDVSGAPTYGEIIYVKYGSTFGQMDLYWNGENWLPAQQKNDVNQAPLFQLFDHEGVSLDDPGRYPDSDFKGNKLFGYALDETGTTARDTVLGLSLTYDSHGEILFENFLKTDAPTYRQGSERVTFPENRFYKILRDGEEVLTNDWYLTDKPSRQMVVDEFVAENNSKLFVLSQEPIDNSVENLKVYRNQQLLKYGIDFIRQYNQILLVQAEDGDIVTAHTFNPENMAASATGLYEIPANLKANPALESVERATRGDLFNQFVEIMTSQDEFSGFEFSGNNWRDIAKDLSRGTHIVAHSHPLLRTMLLASSSDLDITKAIRYSESEYARFRGKFDQKLNEFMIQGRINNTDPIERVVDQIIEEISRGLTNAFPFYLSRMGATETRPSRNYIPPTPSFIGTYGCYEPNLYTDPINGNSFIVGHDGSFYPLIGDRRDYAILELERRIYNSIPEFIRERRVGFFDHIKLISNKHYRGPYGLEEFQSIIRPMFEKWCVTYNVDYKTNDSYNPDDPFTWNWSSARDYDNEPLPGHWRGIYRKYYGTDRPNTHPWEMLGFQVKPVWWEQYYGPAPYTKENYNLWRDIEAGVIRDGERAGIHPEFAHPELTTKYLPVDSAGNLLDPHTAKIARNIPNSTNAKADWKFGDGGPSESAWMNSYWYPFAIAMASYLMRPAEFIETTWNIEKHLIPENTRMYAEPFANEKVYGEEESNGNFVYVHGSQQWICEYLISNSKDITEYLGNKLRGLGVQLGYKVGGFTDANGLQVMSDSIDRIPPEDVNVVLYKSPSIREEFYGGVVIQAVGNHWKVYGYDILDPVFKVIPPDRNGLSVPVSVEDSKRRHIPMWKAGVYYTRNTVVRYDDKFYRCIRTHTSARVFEEEYWDLTARPEYLDAQSVVYYTEAKYENHVERIPYGTVIKSLEQMSDFFSGYERYLRSRGWVFDRVDTERGEVADWKACLREFMRWMISEDSSEGRTIRLVPDARRVHFKTEHGAVEPVEQIVNGVYSILDSDGNPIPTHRTNVVRHHDDLEVSVAEDKNIFALRLYVSEFEHVILVNNVTIFNEHIYSPLFDIRQERLRIQGSKTSNWVGRISAPGFLVNGNLLTPNFEKSADIFRRLFDIEGVEQNNLKDRARANTGYYEKEYLNNLFMAPTNQFEFYQGVIQQKGTKSAIDRILRSNFIRHNEGIKFLEEWAFRIGDFGADESRPSTDFMIYQKDFHANPQLFQFNGVGQGGWDLQLAWDKDHWDYLNPEETATATYSINGIARVVITNPGSGYTQAPTIKFAGGKDNGAELIPVINWRNSGIASVIVNDGGTGYFENDTVMFEGSGFGASGIVSSVDYTQSKVLEVKVTLGPNGEGAGSGYQVGNIVKILGGNGKGRAAVSAVDANGGIVSMTVTDGGGGYSREHPGFEFMNGNQSATGSLKIVPSGGRVLAITVTNPGQGYDPLVAVRILGTGTGAICEAFVTGGSINSVMVRNAGGGFTNVPAITFDGGNYLTQAEGYLVIQQPSGNTQFTLVKFLTEKAALLKRISINVTNEFGGIQPQLQIGDRSNPQRYMSNVGLSEISNFSQRLSVGDQITNEESEIIVTIENVVDSGHVEISLDFEYTPNYYTSLFGDIAADNVVQIYDLFTKETNEFMHRDPRWIWRHHTKMPDWPLIDVQSDAKGNLPSAGYVHLDDINWTTRTWEEFLALYWDKQDQNASTPITNTVSVKYENGVTGTRGVNIIPNLNQGTYRVKNFIIEVTEAFPQTFQEVETWEPGASEPTVDVVLSDEVTISIGTKLNPERYMPRTQIRTSTIQTHTQQVFEYVRAKQDEDSAVQLFVYQATGLTASPGAITVTANIELLGDIIMPGHRVWCYDTGLGDWTVERLTNTGINIAQVRPGSYSNQGAVVSVNKNVFEALNIDHNWQEPKPSAIELNPDFNDRIQQVENRLSKVVLDGVQQGNSLPVLRGTYKSKIKNSARIYIDADRIARTNGNLATQIPIMDLFADTGVVINKITVSVVRPFIYPEGNNPTLTIGTIADPNRFVRAVADTGSLRNRNPEPSRPNFEYGKPITIDVYDDTQSVNEEDGSANIRLLRSGNIYVTPSAIRVTNGGYGYAADSNPKVTVLGPTGVKATAKIEGTIIGFAVVDGGTGYTSAPAITVVGGGGTRAHAVAEISNGKLSAVKIPGTGTGSEAVAIVSGGAVQSVSVNPGSGWQMEPIVVFEGGSPIFHATGKATLNPSGGIASISVANPDGHGGSGYKGTPVIKLYPHTGSGYTSQPRVIVSGGGGSGAVVEPIMLWRVTSITIDDWGKCSWTGENGQVIVEAPIGSAPPVAEIIVEPETQSPTTIQQWRYRVIAPETHPEYGQWKYVDETIEFPVPRNDNNPHYWLQSVNLPLTDVDETHVFEFNIPEFVHDEDGNETSVPNVTNGHIGDNHSGHIRVNNTTPGETDIDLKRIGTPPAFVVNDRIHEDEKMIAYYNPDGVTTGLVTIQVDYHYLSGFELNELTGEPTLLGQTGTGGDLFAWNQVRFASYDDFKNPHRQPAGEWIDGDIVWLDDGRNQTERPVVWEPGMIYEYHDLVEHNGKFYRAIQQGRGFAATISAREDGSLDRPKITNWGTKYTHEPQMTITGDGTGASGRVLLSPTSIYKIKVKNPESNRGYSGHERIIIEPKNERAGRDAHAVIGTVVNGSIKDVELVSGGWGFDAAPHVYIENDNSPEPVEFEVVLVPSAIRGIQMITRGTDYTEASLSFTEHYPTTSAFVPDEWEGATVAVPCWRVMQAEVSKNGDVAWNVLREQTPKVDSSLIESATIYDLKSRQTQQSLQLYDPYKGYIPGLAERELTYILEYDPATYNSGPNARDGFIREKLWGAEQVGELWWDIRTTRYLDYEIDSTEYRWRNWGKLAPGVTVDVYEWTRSTVHPEEWENAVVSAAGQTFDYDEYRPTGTVKDIETGPSYVTQQEYNSRLNRYETVYYFWVKNASALPPVQGRKATAAQVAQYIQDPTQADIPWFAVIDTNKVIVGGTKQYVDDSSSVLSIKWKTNHNEGNHHKQWFLIREGDDRTNINETLWGKMRDSLVGWDKNTETKTVISTITNVLNSDSKFIELEDGSEFDDIGEFKIGDEWFQYKWKEGNRFYGVRNIGFISFPIGTAVSQTIKREARRQVPEQWLGKYERYGNLTRPAQSWFKVDIDEYGFYRAGREARKAFIDTLNDILSRNPILDTRFDWRAVFDAAEPEPSEREYHHVVDDFFARNFLAETSQVQPGQLVLVRGNVDTEGFWSLWRYAPTNPQAQNGFIVERSQRWRLQEGELWEAVDWHAEGWGPERYPTYRFATIKERDEAQIDVTLLDGTLVLVDKISDEDPRWRWFLYREDGWLEVAREKATIRLKDAFYADGRVVFADSGYELDDIVRRDGSWEMQWILDKLQNSLLTGLERNELFFSMVHTSISQHDTLDWAFKTSFLFMSGYEEELTQSPIQLSDQVENLLAHVEEVKPYHTKVRDFIRRLKTPVVNVNAEVTDFDKPMYWDEFLNNGKGGYRQLNMNNPLDLDILRTDREFKDWYANYRKDNYDLDHYDANWNPVRRQKITMLYDRVSCRPVYGWDPIEVPWDSSEIQWRGTERTKTLSELQAQYQTDPSRIYRHITVTTTEQRDRLARDSQKAVNEGNPPLVNIGDIVIVTKYPEFYMWTGTTWVEFVSTQWDSNWKGGLADRVEKFYNPRLDMKRKDLSDLIRGCGFRGTVVEGGDFDKGMFGMFAWDTMGWDNEYDYYTGNFDINYNPSTSDWEASDNGSKDASALNDWDIRVEGNRFVQPWYSEGHPDELVQANVLTPLQINICRKSDTQMATDHPGQAPSATEYSFDDRIALRFFKDVFGKWEGIHMEDLGLTLAEDLTSTAGEVRINVPAGVELYDPATTPASVLREKVGMSLGLELDINNPPTPEKIMETQAYMIFKGELDTVLDDLDLTTPLDQAGIDAINDVMDDVLRRYVPGIIWVGTERIEYREVEVDGNVWVLKKLNRGSGGTSRVVQVPAGSKVIDGSVLRSLTYWNAAEMKAKDVYTHKLFWDTWLNQAANADYPGIEV